MRLYLVQHGDAVPEQVDPQRPLSAAGRREVEAIGRLLASAGVRSTRVVHSGKLRAEQTAELLAMACAPDHGVEASAGLSPNDPVKPVARTIASWPMDTMARGPAVDGRAAVGGVLGDMRGDPQLAHRRDETGGVEVFVAADGDRMPPGHACQHGPGHLALGGAVGLADPAGDPSGGGP